MTKRQRFIYRLVSCKWTDETARSSVCSLKTIILRPTRLVSNLLTEQGVRERRWRRPTKARRRFFRLQLSVCFSLIPSMSFRLSISLWLSVSVYLYMSLIDKEAYHLSVHITPLKNVVSFSRPIHRFSLSGFLSCFLSLLLPVRLSDC